MIYESFDTQYQKAIGFFNTNYFMWAILYCDCALQNNPLSSQAVKAIELKQKAYELLETWQKKYYNETKTFNGRKVS